MKTQGSTLLIANQGPDVLKVHLEPWPELHRLRINQGLEVVVERSDEATGPFFEVRYLDGAVVVCPAGNMNFFVDIFAMRDGSWSSPRFAGHSGGCGLSCDELARRAHFQP